MNKKSTISKSANNFLIYSGMKKGISLIVLVITIIVIIILSATTITTLSNNGIISKAQEAVFKNDTALVKEKLAMELLKDSDEELTIKDLTDNISLANKFAVIADQLVQEVLVIGEQDVQ